MIRLQITDVMLCFLHLTFHHEKTLDCIIVQIDLLFELLEAIGHQFIRCNDAADRTGDGTGERQDSYNNRTDIQWIHLRTLQLRQ